MPVLSALTTSKERKRDEMFPTPRESQLEKLLAAEIAERRRVEARHRSLIESLPVIVYVVAAQPPYSPLYVSSGIEALGYSVDEWHERPDLWVSILHAEDRERVLRETASAMDEGRSVDYEYRVVARDGSTRWLHDRGSFVFDDAGVATCWQGVMMDITERKLTEKALQKSEAGLIKAQQIAHLGSWDSDLVTGELNWSDEVYRIFGVEPQEFAATIEAFFSYVHPDDIGAVREASAEAAAGRRPYYIEHRIVRPDGTERIVREQAEIDFDTDGTALCMLGTVQDITEQKQIEAQLRQQLDFTGALTSSMGEGVFAMDYEGRVIFMNPSAEKLLGWTQSELFGKNIHEHIHYQKEDGAPYLFTDCPMFKLMRSVEREPVQVEDDKFIRRNGEFFPVAYIASPIISNGQVIGSVQSFQDITERKQTEAALREAESRQRQSQKMEAVGQLAGGIAHDFNNLLTVITGYSDLSLRSLEKNKPLHRNISEISRAANRAASLTRQLLAFSRKQMLQPKILDLNNIVADMDKMLQRLIGEDIDLLTVLDPALGLVKADPGQIEQVLLNLAVNARDAMPKGGKLTIETSNVIMDEAIVSRYTSVKSGPHVMLTVTDTGCGMDARTQEQVFEPFFTTKEVGKGTGLGLSTVYGIVKQSDGSVWVKSEVGHGTTFMIYLPRVNKQATAISADEHAALSLSRGTETVLLVEDETQVRELARQLLETEGYTVLESVNGEEALAICERSQVNINLLLTDVVMPQMSGRELAERLMPTHPQLRVLYMSGYTDDAIVHHGLLKDSNDPTEFIQKPFTPDALARKVRAVLDIV
jgi:PAS domain S-box-containing protein